MSGLYNIFESQFISNKGFESESEFSVVRYKFPVTHCLSFSFSCTNLDFAFMGTSLVVVVVVEKFD